MSIRPTHRHSKGTTYRRPGGPWDLPTLEELLADAPPRPVALVDGDLRLSSARVTELVRRAAAGLAQRGVRRGDAVAWQVPNSWEAVVLTRATWRLGAIAVPVHHQAGEHDAEHVLARVSPRVVLGSAHLPLGRRAGSVVLSGMPLPGRRHQAPAARFEAEFADLLAGDEHDTVDARPSDVAAVLFTAGSTGRPKGVLHTHRTLGSKARQMVEVHGLGPNDTVLMPAPLAHVSGLLNGILVPTLAGAGTVLQARWHPAAALTAIERHFVTFMVGPPTFFVSLMGSPEFRPPRVASLRLVSAGGAGVTEAFTTAAASTLGARVKRSYGSTEAPTVTTSAATDDRGHDAVTDGRPHGATELRVVDPDTGAARPPGEPGELWVRGPEVCAGYLDEDDTANAFARGGWYRTGDLATIDDGGWLTITGRLRDVVIRGGENISVAEVEAVLEAHPAVRHAVVVGYPDERLGERVAAFVVADRPFDLAACQAWFDERGVARFKTPEKVIALPEVPTLAAGKPDRSALRARAADDR